MSQKIEDAVADSGRHARCFFVEQCADVCEMCREKARRFKSLAEARKHGATVVLDFWGVN